MPKTLSPIDVNVEEAAAILGASIDTVRRRVSSDELQGTREGRRYLVHLDPQTTWVRVEDAGAMLGLSTQSIRGGIQREELVGRRLRSGRWQVRLGSVLRHRRAPFELLAPFTGEAPPREPVPVERPRGKLTRDLTVRLPAHVDELLVRGREQYGSYNALVAAGIEAVVVEGMSPAEMEGLHAERELYRERAEAAEAERRKLRELVARQVVETLYCPRCEKLVGVDEWGYQELEDGSVEIFHAEHDYSRGGKVRSGTVMATRFAADAA